jgi:hypothetical protein
MMLHALIGDPPGGFSKFLVIKQKSLFCHKHYGKKGHAELAFGLFGLLGLLAPLRTHLT